MRFGVVGAGLALALLLALFWAGCAPHRAALAPPKNDNDISILLVTHPASPQQMDGTQFVVQVRDKSGKPITRALVTMQLAMPTMDMGRNEVALHEAAATPGTYIGTGRFTMPGDWQAVVQIDKRDKKGQHAEKTVPLTVR